MRTERLQLNYLRYEHINFYWTDLGRGGHGSRKIDFEGHQAGLTGQHKPWLHGRCLSSRRVRPTLFPHWHCDRRGWWLFMIVLQWALKIMRLTFDAVINQVLWTREVHSLSAALARPGGGGLCWSRVQPKALKVPPWSPSNSRVATMSAAVPAKLQRILKFKYAKILQQSYIFIFC